LSRSDTIPVVDFTPFVSGGDAEKRKTATIIRDACEDIGFFYLTNHGVPDRLSRGIFDECRRFFSLPTDVKLEPSLRVTPQRNRGYQPMSSRLYANAGAPDLNEGFKYQLDLPADDPDVVAGDRVHQLNRWPDGLPGWREALQEYYVEMERLMRRLLSAFGLALDLDEGFFLDFYRKPITQIILLHYPPQDPMSPADAYGIRPHTDATSFTIVNQDEVGGMQVSGTGGWIDAVPIPGTFLINIGDMMARWTNGRFASTQHRVYNRTGRERYSVPFFAIPDFDAVVECLPSCQGPGNPPKYPALHVGRSLQNRFATNWTPGLRKDEPVRSAGGSAA
jgi:isopenicillin N synthase-like dioxygenase